MFALGKEGRWRGYGVVGRGQAQTSHWVSHDSFCRLMDGGIWVGLLKGACGASL